MSVGISISTFFDDNTSKKRHIIFQESIQSLLNTDFDGKIFIVDDGSSIHNHLNFLSSFADERLCITQKNTNGGISKCKNTGTRLILESGLDIGFLADDDVIYKNGWDKQYVTAIKGTQIPHFCCFVDAQKNTQVIKINDTNIIKTPYVNGAFLSFTKNLIDNIGYFKIMPYKYGHEHSNFSRRCLYYKQIPFFCDVVDSNNYVNIHEDSTKEKSIACIDKLKFNMNNQIACTSFDKCHCIE